MYNIWMALRDRPLLEEKWCHKALGEVEKEKRPFFFFDLCQYDNFPSLAYHNSQQAIFGKP